MLWVERNNQQEQGLRTLANGWTRVRELNPVIPAKDGTQCRGTWLTALDSSFRWNDEQGAL